MQEIPEMVIPSAGSTIAFVGIIAFVVAAFIASVWFGGPAGQPRSSRQRWTIIAGLGISSWLAIHAAITLSGILKTEMMPPPVMLVIPACLIAVFGVVVSPLGKRLATLPVAALISFQAFRLPLELILHDWYKAGTLPVQMTYEGHNFDIVTGIAAIAFGAWAISGKAPRAAIWFFNILGTTLLLVVMFVAVTSSPIPIRQYMNDPPVLLAFHFPYSWIVSIAVSGALLGHLILFRNLLSQPLSQPLGEADHLPTVS